MISPKFGRFAAVAAQPLKVGPRDLVRLSPLGEEQRLPLVCEPNVAGLDLVSYAGANRDFLGDLLVRHGAILFRGFDVASADSLQGFVAATAGPALEYTERSSPRSRVSGRIFTSTDYPPEFPIFLHNEQSYNLTFPRGIHFLCLQAAATGGATPIADCRRVLRRIPAAIRERCERRGYMYVRNFGDGCGLAWQDAFQTADAAAVEAYCRDREIACEWKSGGRLRTRQVRPVTARHPRTGELTWFNHLTFFHVSTLVPAVRDALLQQFDEADLPNNTYYGDGSPIEPAVMDELRAHYAAETVSFPWQAGDVLALDNMLTAHARQPFTGSRKVVVAMAEPTDWSAVA
jgi:alpha-ketoglutarate-dependent taurine dioxygenase